MAEPGTAPALATSMKRFDSMHQLNERGTFLCTQDTRAKLSAG